MSAPVRFARLELFHVKQLVAGPSRRLFRGDLSDTMLREWVAGDARVALLDDADSSPGGRVVGAGGVINQREERGQAWALLSAEMPARAWPAVIAEMRRTIDSALDPRTGWARRVWAETLYDWVDGHKLMLHLGMSLEGLNRGSFPDGQHGVTYARVRGDVPALPVRWRCLLQTAERCLWEDTMAHAVPWAIEHARRRLVEGDDG